MTESLNKLLNYLKENSVQLVAVSKTKPVEEIMRLYSMGQRHFAENRVQELLSKIDKAPQDISWHLIGHLQKNKVKYIAPFIYMIQSVDSLALAKKIDAEAHKNERIISVLLQPKIAQEDSKFGYDPELLLSEIESLKALDNINICGLMGMGTLTDDQTVTRKEFKYLRSYYENLKQSHFSDHKNFNTLSMGMSGDYALAVEEGSTMVRIGSLLFGARS